MLLNGARLPARLDGEGNILRLEEQDRSRWDRPMIARGMYHLMQSTAGDEAGEYHLQAAIATMKPEHIFLSKKIQELNDADTSEARRGSAAR